MTNIDADLNSEFPINIRNNILTETGIQQAMDFAHKLKGGGIELQEIVCSPYARTKQTAYTIASVLATMVPIHYNNKFKEIEWDVGGKFDRLEKHIPGFDSKTLAVSERPVVVRNRDLPVGETLTDSRRGAYTLESQEDVYNRVIPAFVKLSKKAKKKNILLVTHFFVVRAIDAFMAEGTPEAMLRCSPTNLCLHSFTAEDVLAQWDKHPIA